MPKNQYIDIVNEKHMYLNFGEQPDVFCIQLGYELMNLADNRYEAPLLKEISKCRKEIDEELGLYIPPVHIVDNLCLKPCEYVILFNGVELGRYEINLNYNYWLDSGDVTTPINTDSFLKTIEPGWGMDVFLVPKDENKQFKDAGYLCIKPVKLIYGHFFSIVRANRTKILNQSMVNSLVQKVCKKNPDVVTDVFFNKKFETADMKILLNRLLAEDVSIRDMNTILETIADNLSEIQNPIQLAERVRERLAYSFISQYADNSKCVHVIRFSQRFIEFLSDQIFYPQGKNEVPYFAFEKKDRSMFIKKTSKSLAAMTRNNFYPLFITLSSIRLALFESLRNEIPSVRVISDMEFYNLDDKLKLILEDEIDLDGEYKSEAVNELESLLNSTQEL